MPDSVTQIVPHEKVLLIAVQKRALDDAAAKRLTDDVLAAAAATPHLPVVLDMGRVHFAPSVALGTLVQLTKSFRLDGRRLILIQVDPNVLGSIRVTNLHSLLEIYASLSEAVQAIAKG